MNTALPAPHEYRNLTCSHCGFRISVPIDCGFRFCPTCSKRRAFRVRNRLQWIFDNSRPEPGYMLKMVTLSTFNCKDLEAGTTFLVSCFRKLRYRALWKRCVSGGATIVEIKGRPNSWHPHLHILCYARWLPWRELRSAWMNISGGTAVYIQNVSTDRAKLYATKYVTKAEVPPFLLDGVSRVLIKYRLFQRFGNWHSLRIPKRLFDYPCPTCSKTAWLADYIIDSYCRRSPSSSRSPPAVPVLNKSDLQWYDAISRSTPSLAPPSARRGARPENP